MKSIHIRINALIPALGIALVIGGLLVAMIYQKLEEHSKVAEASITRAVYLYHDLQLCAALRTMREGDATAAEQRLDRVLCNDIVALNSQLPSADAEEQAYVKNAFARFALIRPRSAELLANNPTDVHADQVEAEKILERSAGAILGARGAVAALP
jgi:hypothetical protein